MGFGTPATKSTDIPIIETKPRELPEAQPMPIWVVKPVRVPETVPAKREGVRYA